jgi:Ni,Fe-hydrogenase III large subunit
VPGTAFRLEAPARVRVRARVAGVERKDVSDRQLEALLSRLDAIQAELARINRRLEANEGFLQVTRELRNLNESLNAIAYAALGQSPQVRRRRTG